MRDYLASLCEFPNLDFNNELLKTILNLHSVTEFILDQEYAIY
jgi:hypothetical protein